MTTRMQWLDSDNLTESVGLLVLSLLAVDSSR
uniref:Uncharacterized protein n=1 Tax=Setaria italica TaxID=4555 RepID=K3YNK3_SETIT